MEHQSPRCDSPPPSRQRLVQLLDLEYRTLVMRRLDVTAGWRGLEWTVDAVCTYEDGSADGAACSRCPVMGECLAAAIATDDIAGRPGGLSRSDRECLWAGMERTYRDLCDLELMARRNHPSDHQTCRSSTPGPRERPAAMTTIESNGIDLYADTIAILTGAATKSSSDDIPDFADFPAHVLAATAATVGGPHLLVAERPGSWESRCLDSLIRGTMGDRPDDWTWFRTQPIVVPLNVAELIEDELHHPGLMGL